MWHVDDVVSAVKGTPYRIENTMFSGISTDSRTIGEGELYIPLVGKHYDGHAFIQESYQKSHVGAICDKGREEAWRHAQGTIILVDDTLSALAALATHRRKQWAGTFIGITGSNGKTTTKEILVHMLRGISRVQCNEKNYNNIIGVSKSILSADGEADYFVFELGSNSKGEIGSLARIIEPHMSLITNINPSHLEGLMDLEGVLEEKLQLFYLTKQGGAVMVNADDPYILPRYQDDQHVAYTFGIENPATFRLSIDEDLGWDGFRIILTLSGTKFKARTGLLGRHNLYNILSAASIAHAAGVGETPIRTAIESFTSYAMRFRPIKSKKGYIVIDDSYNANPASMKWAIETLRALPCKGRRFAVLGDMKELGEKSPHYHRELGRFLRTGNLSMTMLIGQEIREAVAEAGGERTKYFEDTQLLITYLKKSLQEEDVVLVKGSRAARMEEIVEALI